MQEINNKDLKEGYIYWIEYHGPEGILKKYRGIFQRESPLLHRFNNVTQYCKGTETSRIWFHTASTTNSTHNFFYRFLLPVSEDLKRRVSLYYTKMTIARTLSVQKALRERFGDPSTVMGLAHGYKRRIINYE